jgi:hypothetical protein
MIEFYGGYQVYSESGVDLTLLRGNLRRSLEERWENQRRAAAFSQMVAYAERVHRGLPARPEYELTRFDPAGLLRHLVSHPVEVVVVGGLAMTTHGSAYVTYDLDLCYRRSDANLAALADVLIPLHPYLRNGSPRLPFPVDAQHLRAGLNFALTTDLGDLDLVGELAGVGNDKQVFVRSEVHTLFGMEVRVLSLDALIASKEAAGRRKDRLHLLELEELKKITDAPPEG